MLPTSGTFNFQSISIELIIREAFEKIGLSGEFIEPVKLESAKRSIDLIFLEWMNKSVNLWTLETGYLSLSPNRTDYFLPEYVSNIIQANIRTSTRQVTTPGGLPSSSSGTAANAFDGNPNTACTQTAPNGYIGYQYLDQYTDGQARKIDFLGITSNTTQDYTLELEISLNNLVLYSYTFPKQTYISGETVWVDVNESFIADGYLIAETGGATLDIQEIYFNNNVLDSPISNVSRNDIFALSNKFLSSKPSVYYLDRQITPILNLWPAPTAQYNCLQYAYKMMIEDAGKLYTNSVQIPARFYPALIWRLAWELAIKFSPERAQMLAIQADIAFESATIEDSESVPLKVYGDESSYYE